MSLKVRANCIRIALSLEMCELSLGAFAMSLTNVRGQPKFRVPQNVHGVSSPQEDNLVSLIPEPIKIQSQMH